MTNILVILISTTVQAWPSKWDWTPSSASDLQQSGNFNDITYVCLAESYLLLAEVQFKLGEKAIPIESTQ